MAAFRKKMWRVILAVFFVHWLQSIHRLGEQRLHLKTYPREHESMSISVRLKTITLKVKKIVKNKFMDLMMTVQLSIPFKIWTFKIVFLLIFFNLIGRCDLVPSYSQFCGYAVNVKGVNKQIHIYKNDWEDVCSFERRNLHTSWAGDRMDSSVFNLIRWKRFFCVLFPCPWDKWQKKTLNWSNVMIAAYRKAIGVNMKSYRILKRNVHRLLCLSIWRRVLLFDAL